LRSTACTACEQGQRPSQGAHWGTWYLQGHLRPAVSGDTVGMDRSKALAEFLRTRRARLLPSDVGLPDSPRRRTPGLRRDDVARLADVSVEYYTRLEQGRKVRPSPTVVDCLARALRLQPDERDYLAALAMPEAIGSDAPSHAPVRHGLRQLLAHLDHLPCVVLGPYCEVLAWNRLAAALMVDFGCVPMCQRNILRLLVLDERMRSRYVNFEEVLRRAVAQLRAVAVQCPDDPALTSLVGELCVKSEHFREAWARHDVAMNRYGTKIIRHPEVGEIELSYEVLNPGGASGPYFVIHTVEPGSPSATALELLAVIADQDLSAVPGTASDDSTYDYPIRSTHPAAESEARQQNARSVSAAGSVPGVLRPVPPRPAR
jgi:transcriptional regulator with XRE-family HTH domain